MTPVNLLASVRSCSRLQRNARPDALDQCVPVAQQEEQQVEHDEQAENEVQRVLAEVRAPVAARNWLLFLNAADSLSCTMARLVSPKRSSRLVTQPGSALKAC